MSFQLIKQAHAVGDVDLGEKFTLGIGGNPVKDTYGTPADLVNPLVKNVMIAGGIILFFMFILAGFKFLQDTTKGKEEAVKILKTALIGFIVMFSAFWIVQIIQLITGADIRI
jgi:hypothetical protein